jgi:hypothetical protein
VPSDHRSCTDHGALADSDIPDDHSVCTNFNMIMQSRTATAGFLVADNDAIAQDDVSSDDGLRVHHEAEAVENRQSGANLCRGSQFGTHEALGNESVYSDEWI